MSTAALLSCPETRHLSEPTALAPDGMAAYDRKGPLDFAAGLPSAARASSTRAGQDADPERALAAARRITTDKDP